MRNKPGKFGITVLFVLISLFAGIVIFVSSINTFIPSRDSGAFLYEGRGILHGLVPYRDLWDHKTPLVYAINALALQISGHTLWGLWLIEILTLTAALFGIFFTLNTKSRFRIFFTAIAFVILVYKTIEGGNRVEEYAMFFQVCFILTTFGLGLNNDNKNKGNSFAAGVFGSMLFLLKPNLVACLVVYFLWLVAKKNYSKLLPLSIGALMPIVILAVMLWRNNSLPSAIDQIFLFNKAYSTAGVETIGYVLGYSFNLLWPFSLIFVFYPLWIIFQIDKRGVGIFLISWLVVELILSLVSARTYKQYFLPFVVPLVLTWNVLIEDLESLLNRKKRNVALAVLAVIILLFAKKDVLKVVKGFDNGKPFDKRMQFRSYLYHNFGEHGDILEVIKENTATDDKILIWGSEPAILFLSNRESVDRYFYQFRLFLPGYDIDENRLSEHVGNIQNKIPNLIVDASSSTVDYKIGEYPQSPPLTFNNYQKWLRDTGNKPSRYIYELIEFIEKNYKLKTAVYEGKWDVYLKK